MHIRFLFIVCRSYVSYASGNLFEKFLINVLHTEKQLRLYIKCMENSQRLCLIQITHNHLDKYKSGCNALRKHG